MKRFGNIAVSGHTDGPVPVSMVKMSRSYDDQILPLPFRSSVADLRFLTGTNCYCDREAAAAIRSAMEGLPVCAVHLIDSGNYHYLTRLWLERVRDPFLLVIFDNHTDMQAPAFGDLLSCGGWAASSAAELKALRGIVLAGPDEESVRLTDRDCADRTVFVTGRELKASGADAFRAGLLLAWRRFVGENRRSDGKTVGIYLSIDKDILCRKDAVTGWSQGEMRLEELVQCIAVLADFCRAEDALLLGTDICGELEDSPEADRVNGRANDVLIRTILEADFPWNTEERSGGQAFEK